MDRLAYFLAFGRLARRTVVFWGHATTSGITRFDARPPPPGERPIAASHRSTEAAAARDPARDPVDDPVDGPVDGPVNGEDGGGGGPDYFVSSELFEAPFGGQRRYSERLYLMRGVTTCFAAPTPPDAAALALAPEDLGLPPLAPLDPTAAHDGAGARLYLVRQIPFPQSHQSAYPGYAVFPFLACAYRPVQCTRPCWCCLLRV